MDNAADRKSIRRAEKAAALELRNRGEVLFTIMSTEPGRQWIWGQLERAHIFEQSFAPDALLTAFREGERAQGQMLLSDIMGFCPEEFIQAMREANGRRTERHERDNRNGTAGEQRSDSESGRLDQGYADSAESFPDGEEDRGQTVN